MNESDDIVQIAATAHEVNRTYCAGLGDFSQPPWHMAPDWQRDSAIDGVNRLIEDPSLPPSASHDNWMAHKLKDGWKYGPVKDPDKKEHPSLVPYEELSSEERAKDTIFRTVVLGLAGDLRLDAAPSLG